MAVCFFVADFFAAFLTVVFLAAVFLFPEGCAFAASAARFSAQRRFVAAMIAALPARLSFRFGLGVASGADGSAAFFDAAHLARCAAAILARPAALISRRLCFGGAEATAGSVEPPDSMARSSAIWA